MTATVTPTPIAPPAPRRKRRFWRKLFVGLVVAAVVVFAVVQAVLWSDYPRQIAVGVAQKITGLRVEIGRLTIEWSGHTTIDDLRVSLPLAERPFLVVPHVDARHTPLPLIVLTVNVAIDAVTVEKPVLDVRQDRDRGWNLQQVVAQLTTPGKNAAAGGSVQLPDVTLADATVRVTTADARTVDIKDIALTGRRGGALAWAFDAHAADLLTATGAVSTAGRWPNRATVSVHPAVVDAWRPLLGDALKAAAPVLGGDPKLAARFDWTGRRTDTGVAGRLTIADGAASAGPVTAAGVADVNFDGSVLRVSPDGLTVVYPAQPPVTFVGGTLAYTPATSDVAVTDLRTRVAGGTVRCSARGNVADRRGTAAVSWEQVTYPAGITHQGSVELDAASIWPDKPWVRGNFNLLAQVAGGTFEARAAVRGDGPSWTDATYAFDVPVLRYGKQSQLALTNATATLHNTADTVELVGVRLSSAAKLDARGLYHFAGPNAGTGYFTAVGDGFDFGPDQNLGFNVNAWADAGTVTLQNAYAHLGTEAWANLAGQYVGSRPEPIGMQLDFDSDPDLSLQLSDKIAVAGHASGTLTVGGTLAPPNVLLNGTVASRKLKAAGLLIGDADLTVHGNLGPHQASVHTEHLTAFGGDGWFGAEFPYFADTLHAWTGFDHLDAAAVGKAVGQEGLSGVASGDLDVHIPLARLRGTYGTGRIDVQRPAFAPLVEADRLTVPVRIGDGYVRALPAAVQAKGGRATVDVLAQLDRPTRLKLSVGLENWLTALPALAEFSALTSGSVDLPQIDLKARSASGVLDLDQQFFAHTAAIGRTATRVHADGRQVKLEHVAGDVLGGVVYANGSVNLDDLAAGELWAGVEGLSLDRLAKIDPRLAGVGGRLSGRLHSRAATGPNPLGPVQADVDVTAERAAYKGIEIGNSHVTAFLDANRVALADTPKSPNTVALAGGQALLWGRLDRVPPGADHVPRTSAFASVYLQGLDTEQLNKLVDPDGRPVPGRLDGTVTAFGDPREIRQLSGQGVLKLYDSDLANVGVLAVLYDAMHADFGGKPAGHGAVQFSLNAGRLDVTDLDYFNHGIFAKGAISVHDVLNVKTSPFQGYMIGTYRPLKDISLPFFGTVDSILDALQSSATTLQVSGDLKHVKAVPTSLKAIGGGLRNILVGQAQAK